MLKPLIEENDIFITVGISWSICILDIHINKGIILINTHVRNLRTQNRKHRNFSTKYNMNNEYDFRHLYVLYNMFKL